MKLLRRSESNTFLYIFHSTNLSERLGLQLKFYQIKVYAVKCVIITSMNVQSLYFIEHLHCRPSKSDKIEPSKYQKDKMSLEERQTAFREMLLDREVSAFSTWDKELHKIVFDPRYLLLSGRERKQAYESFIKSRAEDERVEKRNKIKDNRDAFKKLIEKANLSSRSYTKSLCFKHAYILKCESCAFWL